MVAELEEDTLNLYGPLALGAFDRNWGLQAAGAVTTICFKFIDFDEICKQIHKVRSRFPSTQVGRLQPRRKVVASVMGMGGWIVVTFLLLSCAHLNKKCFPLMLSLFTFSVLSWRVYEL